MALDFHRLDNREYLFGLNDEQYNFVYEIFKTFKHSTGLVIDLHADLQLSIENQLFLIKIIDKYIESNDLNKNKEKTSVIIEFKGLLTFFSNHKINLILFGD
jgi:hypothetical protein